MKSLVCFAVSAAFAMSCGAQSLGSLADVAVIDRDTGVTLNPYYYRGEYWVAGRPGARYAIEIRNHLGERLLAVTSVDGVNVLSGADAAWDQAGYVFGGGESYQITGWRKSSSEIAAFTFTASPNSYAERTGRPANVGVIGVALFREKPPVVYSPPTIGGHPPVRPDTYARRSDSAAAGAFDGRQESLAESAPADRAASTAGAPAPSAPAGSPQAAQIAPQAKAMQAPKLGTGHGEREYSYVNYTEFARLQPQPNEVIRIRYDSMDNLLAMGVIKRPRPVSPNLNPFPGSPQQQQFVPDPPG
jgi:hypothetical protein